MKRTNKRIDDQQIIEACDRFQFMSEAAVWLDIHLSTLRSRAIKLGVYKPASRQEISRRGSLARSEPKNKIKTEDILNGKVPQYSTNHLRVRLLKEGILENRCSQCGNEGTWDGKPLTLELDHINGIRSDHRKENLRLLCPNCHSQTPTYKSKNRNNRES